LLTTRRGQQFNSMVWKDRDPLTSAGRNEIFVARRDAARPGLAEGARLRLRSEVGEYVGLCRLAEVALGTLQAYWADANVLVASGLDPRSKEPDYNARVELERV
jgi:anaerobic selenocysteine-containing dehydrogenase